MPETEMTIWRTKMDGFCENTKHELASAAIARKSLKADIREIKNNHLAHLSDKVEKVDKRLTRVETNTDWMKKIQWAVVSGIIGNLIGIIYLIINRI